jgi:hypothetical protein
MKSLHEYITERLEQYKESNRIITVYSSTKTKLTDKSLDELGKMIYKDYLKACEVREEEAKKSWEEGYEFRKNWELEPAQKWAQQRWKTDRGRQRYLDTVLKKFERDEEYYKNKKEKEGYSDGRFLMDTYYGTSDGMSVIEKNDAKPEEFAWLLKKIKDNPQTAEFFNEALGWEFVSIHREKAHYTSSELRLILPPNMVRKIKDNKKRLSDDIDNFYNNPPAGCDPRWWGD